jgi:branched-chain amino acid transport system permease protein
MDFYLGLIQIMGVHTLIGLSAYCVLLTGQVSLAQAGFFAIGAYVAGMLTVLWAGRSYRRSPWQGWREAWLRARSASRRCASRG